MFKQHNGDIGPRSRDSICPSFASRFASLYIERAQGDRVPAAPAAPNAVKRPGPDALSSVQGPGTFSVHEPNSPQVQTVHRPPCAMDVAAYSALSPVIRLLATVACISDYPPAQAQRPITSARTTRLRRLPLHRSSALTWLRQGEPAFESDPFCEPASARRRSKRPSHSAPRS